MKKWLALMLFAALLCSLFASAYSAEENDVLQLWFEHPTHRMSETDREPSGMDTYTIQMAKNEIEGAQFVLYSEDDLKDLSISISDFSDGKGNLLTADLFWEYYTVVEGDGVADAIPPLTGPISIDGGFSQAFYFKVKTLQDTPAGTYTATVTVTADDGTVLKTADVSVKVYNFALPEATSCDTAFYLDKNQLANKHPKMKADDIYKIYYDYMLENRVCAYSLPYDLRSSADVLAEYLDNPRVNSFRVGDFSYSGSLPPASVRNVYRTLSSNPEWLEKAYFYYVDEPGAMEAWDAILSGYEEISEVFPDPTVLVPMVHDIEISDTLDGPEYVKDVIGIWCPITFAFTPRDATVSGTINFQPEKYDSVLGTFEERMKQQQEAGKKVWWYTCCTPQDQPYNNILLTQQGMSGRLLFWQQKQYNIEGYLYYYMNLWFKEDYWDHLDYIWHGGNAYGDGILIYDGAKYGIDGPIGSLRFEAIRDGIEDFEVLTMLENVAGREAVDAFIETLSTDVVTATTDEELFMKTKNALYAALAKELTPPCADDAHQGGEATCTEKAVCEVCGYEYGEINPKNHDYVDGVCTRCGEEKPTFTYGDLNGDGSINASDSVLLKRYLAGWTLPIDEAAADINGDGTVNASDSTLLSRYLAGWKVDSLIE